MTKKKVMTLVFIEKFKTVSQVLLELFTVILRKLKKAPLRRLSTKLRHSAFVAGSNEVSAPLEYDLHSVTCASNSGSKLFA